MSAGHTINRLVSRNGVGRDNAPMDSVFGTLETRQVNGRRSAAREEAKRDLFASIEGHGRMTFTTAPGAVPPRPPRQATHSDSATR